MLLDLLSDLPMRVDRLGVLLLLPIVIDQPMRTTIDERLYCHAFVPHRRPSMHRVAPTNVHGRPLCIDYHEETMMEEEW